MFKRTLGLHSGQPFQIAYNFPVRVPHTARQKTACLIDLGHSASNFRELPLAQLVRAFHEVVHLPGAPVHLVGQRNSAHIALVQALLMPSHVPNITRQA